MITQSFQFVLCDGTPVTKAFSVKPTTFPISVGQKIITGDVNLISGSPANLLLADNTYDVQLNNQSTNNWYISGSSSQTASINLWSGSYISQSVATVLCDFDDSQLNPFGLSAFDIIPVNANVGWQKAFVLRDRITKTLASNGQLTVTLIPQPYLIQFHGPYRTTTFTIQPSGSCTASAIIISSANVSQIITPKNQSTFAYTAQTSDLRYAPLGSTGGGSSVSCSWASSSLSASVLFNENVIIDNTGDATFRSLDLNNASIDVFGNVNCLSINSDNTRITSDGAGNLSVNGNLNVSGLMSGTASYASNSLSSSYAKTASYSTKAKNSDTASFASSLADNVTINGPSFMGNVSWESNNSPLPLIYVSEGNAQFVIDGGAYDVHVPGGMFGNVVGTASWSNNSISSSYALTASYAANSSGGSGTTLFTGSTYQITSSWANNSLTASYITASKIAGNVATSSWSLNSVSSVSASFASRSFSATSASWASSSISSSVTSKLVNSAITIGTNGLINATIPNGAGNTIYYVQSNDSSNTVVWQALTANGKNFLFGEVASAFPNGNPVDNTSAYGFLQCDGGLVVQLPGGAQGPVYCDTVRTATGLLDTNGVQLTTTQQGAIADATNLSDVVAQLNALLAAMRAHGMIAT